MNPCPKCKSPNVASAKFCESCGKDLQQFSALDDQLELMLIKEARKGAWALGFVAVATAVLPIIMGYDNWVTYGLAAMFAGLAVWAIRAPLIASAIGLTLYGLGVLADAVVDPSTLFQGIIGKVIIVSVLVNAVRSGLKHRNFRRERGLE